MPNAPEFDLLLFRLADRLRACRTAAGLTQEEAAAKAGMVARHLQKVEAGEVNVTVQTLFKLAQAYGVKVSDLFR